MKFIQWSLLTLMLPSLIQAQPEVEKLLQLLSYTKETPVAYNGQLFTTGYHTFTFNGVTYQGGRKPLERLQNVPFDFKGKTVLDIGCNQGGMLFALKDKIKWGVGIDYNTRLVNAANRIRQHYKSHHLSFYNFDLENDPFTLLKSFLPNNAEKVDICFLLSMCMWIKNWRDVINQVHALAPNLLFESNGSAQQQEEQLAHLKATYRFVKLLADQSNDDPGQKNRKLYFCQR